MSKCPVKSKRIMAGITLALLVNTGIASAQSTLFRDVTSHWAKADIQLMTSKNIINGYPDGTFRPNQGITREELAKMIAIAYGIKQPSQSIQTYTDVDTQRWSFWYIATVKNFLPYNHQSQKFYPNRLATREEVAVAVIKAMSEPVRAASAGTLTKFTDANKITGAYRDDVAKAVSLGIFGGDEKGRFRPQDSVTRGEISKVLKTVFVAREKLKKGVPGSFLDVSLVLVGTQVRIQGQTEPKSLVFINGKNISVATNGSFSYSLELVQSKMDVNIVAINEAGGRSTVVKTVNKYSKVPKLEVTVPAYTQKELVTVEGVTVPGSRVTIGTEVVQASTADGKFRKAIKMRPGTNVVVVNVETPKGEQLSAQRTVEYESMAEAIVINTPETTKNPNILISGEVPVNFKILLNGQKLSTYPDGKFNHSMKLREEVNSLKFIITAPWGTQTIIERQVIWQMDKPEEQTT